jgi:hypothetical protein
LPGERQMAPDEQGERNECRNPQHAAVDRIHATRCTGVPAGRRRHGKPCQEQIHEQDTGDNPQRAERCNAFESHGDNLHTLCADWKPMNTPVADDTIAQRATRSSSAVEGDPRGDTTRLRERVAVLEHERARLIALVEILQQISSAGDVVEVLHAVARELGYTFGLDRCSVFLAGTADEARLVASYEEPDIGNLIIDLARYPELRLAFESGDTVFIPDATVEPMLADVHDELESRQVQSVVVVPIRWRDAVIGAIFLRTMRGQRPFADDDVQFCQGIASLTATALRAAHRLETVTRSRAHEGPPQADLRS